MAVALADMKRLDGPGTKWGSRRRDVAFQSGGVRV